MMSLNKARFHLRNKSFMLTHSPLSSSFLGLAYRIHSINHKKELLRGLWVGFFWEVLLGAFTGAFRGFALGPDFAPSTV